MATIYSIYRPHSRQKPLDDDLALAKGVYNGLIGSFILWSAIAIAILFFGGWCDWGMR
jgi:hypothetical protein